MSARSYAAACAALDRCSRSGLEPLATFAAEVRLSYRERCIWEMEGSYDAVGIVNCSERLGYSAGEIERMAEALTERGWTERVGTAGDRYLLPPRFVYTDEEEDYKEEDEEIVDTSGGFDADIRALADVVGFMERGRLNV